MNKIEILAIAVITCCFMCCNSESEEETIRIEYWWENAYEIENKLDYDIFYIYYFSELYNKTVQIDTIKANSVNRTFSDAGIGENDYEMKDVFDSIKIKVVGSGDLIYFSKSPAYQQWQIDSLMYTYSEVISYNLIIEEK